MGKSPLGSKRSSAGWVMVLVLVSVFEGSFTTTLTLTPNTAAWASVPCSRALQHAALSGDRTANPGGSASLLPEPQLPPFFNQLARSHAII